MAERIEDYALLGDLQTAALVGRTGSIDWLCFPRFDSGACFASLLGTRDNGRWLIAPLQGGPCDERRYRDGTLILESEWTVDGGRVRVVDFMPPRGTNPDIVRIVEGLEGRVQMRSELVIRFDDGLIVPWVRRLDDGTRIAIGGPDALALRTEIEMYGEDLTTVAEFTVREGDRVPFVLTWFPSHERQPRAVDPERALKETEQFWREWSDRCGYEGDWRDAVINSLRVLKALTYAPTGGIVAAPTTSLPERIGGVRNWDYRYCWLRDATFTLFALFNGGYEQEAHAWRDWLLRSIAGEAEQLQIMYGVAGERRLWEYEADWLSGYAGSRPVRLGNAAAEQFQLDVYGEVMDTFHQSRRHGLHKGSTWSLQRKLMEFLESNWSEPDEGIWEVRGPRRHFTHSKVLAWVGFDRAIDAVERFDREGPLELWKQMRAEIHEEVCREAFNVELNAFVQSYGSDKLDASTLLIPLVGFLPADDPRCVGTVEAIQRELTRDGFVDRYAGEGTSDVDGLPPGEGAFLPCSFWLVDNLALMGRESDARALFERLLGVSNDLGLLSEEYDPAEKRLLGNFPQAFSHVGLVNSAYNLSDHDSPAEQRSIAP